MTIRLLPEHVINRIAAGEVVERPASVVKELVENAIDAGARRVEIVTAGGGKSLIRVADDGCGIRRADLLGAVSRHCTSKLPGDDLAAIATLGFAARRSPPSGRWRGSRSTPATRTRSTAGPWTSMRAGLARRSRSAARAARRSRCATSSSPRRRA
jgi:DNA mismatch repair protein MutL